MVIRYFVGCDFSSLFIWAFGKPLGSNRIIRSWERSTLRRWWRAIYQASFWESDNHFDGSILATRESRKKKGGGGEVTFFCTAGVVVETSGCCFLYWPPSTAIAYHHSPANMIFMIWNIKTISFGSHCLQCIHTLLCSPPLATSRWRFLSSWRKRYWHHDAQTYGNDGIQWCTLAHLWLALTIGDYVAR